MRRPFQSLACFLSSALFVFTDFSKTKILPDTYKVWRACRPLKRLGFSEESWLREMSLQQENTLFRKLCTNTQWTKIIVKTINSSPLFVCNKCEGRGFMTNFIKPRRSWGFMISFCLSLPWSRSIYYLLIQLRDILRCGFVPLLTVVHSSLHAPPTIQDTYLHPQVFTIQVCHKVPPYCNLLCHRQHSWGPQNLQ